MAATINYYDLQAPDETATTLDEVAEYIDYLADFFAEKMGMFIREDLTVKSPSYAQYSYVKFLSLTDGGDPVMCIYNTNKNVFPDAIKNIAITGCNYGGGIWLPSYIWSGSSSATPISSDWAGIWFQGQSWSETRRVLKVITFDDGRVLGVLECFNASSGARSYTPNSFMLITPMIIEGNTEKTMAISASFRTSYMTKYNRYPSKNSDNNSREYGSISHYGILSAYGITDGTKEFLIKHNLYLGPDCYLENIAQFSNLKNALPGDFVVINGKKYFIVLYLGSTNSAYAIPEEVN